MPKTIFIIKPKSKPKLTAPRQKPLQARKVSPLEQLLVRVIDSLPKIKYKKRSTIAKRMRYDANPKHW